MRLQRTADQPRRAGADAELLDRLPRRLAKRRMPSQTKVVVGGKVDELAATELDSHRLRRLDLPQFTPQAGIADFAEVAPELFVETDHQSYSTTSR